MFKLTIAAAIGLSAVVSTAHADTIIVQSGPSFDPAYVTPFRVTPFQGINAYGGAPFERLAQLCATMGFDCTAPLADAPSVYGEADTHLEPRWSAGARADAAKRLALLTHGWEGYASDLEEQYETLPRPVLPRPHVLFGWNAPRTVPLPSAIPHQFGHRFPSIPRTTLPRSMVPQIEGFSDFANRFANPRSVLPRGVLPYGAFPRGAFPRGAFPRHIAPGGRGFTWPSL